MSDKISAATQLVRSCVILKSVVGIEDNHQWVLNNYRALRSSALLPICREAEDYTSLFDDEDLKMVWEIETFFINHDDVPDIDVIYRDDPYRKEKLKEWFKMPLLSMSSFNEILQKVINQVYTQCIAELYQSSYRIVAGDEGLPVDQNLKAMKSIKGVKSPFKVLKGISDFRSYHSYRMDRLDRAFRLVGEPRSFDYAMYEESLKDKGIPLTLPWPSVRERHSIYSHELCLIAGPAHLGKSTVAIYLSMWWAMNKKNGVYISLEMPEVQVWRSLAVCMCNNSSTIKGSISHQAYTKGTLGKGDKDKLAKLTIELKDQKYGYISVWYPDRFRLSDARSFLKSEKSKMEAAGKKLDYAIIDYPNMMDVDGKSRDYILQVNEIIRGLKKVATSLDVAIVCPFHLNRDFDKLVQKNEGKQVVPGLHNLSYSNEADKASDKVIALSPVSVEDNSSFVLSFIKARDEPTGPKERWVMHIDRDLKRITESVVQSEESVQSDAGEIASSPQIG